MEYLTIQEVARILKAHTNTIYKMCREGSLPCVKIGKEWRIDRYKFSIFMEHGIVKKIERPLLGYVDDALKGGHVLGIFTEMKSIPEFELEFFKAAPKEGRRFLKACWWQHPDDVRQYLAAGDFPVEEMESAGSFLIADLGKVFCSSGPVSAAQVWIDAAKNALKKGFQELIGSGSPHFDCCGTHNALMEFEGALDEGLKGLAVTGVCSYFMDNDVSDGFARFVDLAKTHNRFFIKTGEGGIFAKSVTSFA